MANGPFGNPLSAGIALSGVIDLVTPVRQAEERKRQREAAEKKAQDERAKELGAIMGKIAVDEDKIWWRYHDDARIQYADTIDKISQMYNTGDYAGMYKTINQFDTKMANYIQATNQKNARAEDLKKGGFYMDYNLESMSENRDIDNAEYAKYLQETGYGTLGQNGIFSYMPNSKVFDIKDAWERSVKGEEKKLITEAGKGYKQVGTTPTGVIAETDYAPDVLSSAQQRIMNEVYADPYRAARILEKEGYDVKSLESIADPQQRVTRTQEMFSDYIMKNRPGFGEQMLGKWQPRVDKTGSGMTFEDKYTVSDFSEKITNTQVSGIPSGTQMVGKAFNPKGDITSKAKGGYERLVTVSPDSYESINGNAIRKPSRTGETVTINMVPMGIVTLKGSQDNRVFASYRYVTDGGPGTAEQIHMHYEPLNRDDFKDRNNVEFRDYAGLTDDEFVSYYNEVAGMAGFPKFKGSASAAGTGSQSSKSSSSSVSTTSLDIKKMSGMKYGDFKDPSNKAWVDETAKKIRSMSNIDDLWKQTGKSGTPNGQSNAELLAGFVESGKTDLLTGSGTGNKSKWESSKR